VNAIQLTGLAATHEHSRATLMFSVPVPPDAAWFDGVDETFASQRVDAGAVTLVEVLAEEVKGTGITANAVAPTILRTEANRRAMPDGDAGLWVSIGELAGAILTLCSPESGGINGTTLTVRGGL